MARTSTRPVNAADHAAAHGVTGSLIKPSLIFTWDRDRGYVRKDLRGASIRPGSSPIATTWCRDPNLRLIRPARGPRKLHFDGHI
jgi:hypothetical protein